MTPLGESGSEVSHFIPGPRNFAEVTNNSDNMKKPRLKANLKEIKDLIKNQTFLIEDLNKSETVAPWMDVYKANIKSDGSPDRFKYIIMVRGDMQNKKLVGDTWSPTSSMRTCKYLMAYATKQKAIVHELDFIIALLQ